MLDEVARRLLARLEKTTSAGKSSHVVFTGGSTFAGLMNEVVDLAPEYRVSWELVHVWWSDERFVDRQDSRRNDTLVRLDSGCLRLPLKMENIHSFGVPSDGDVVTVAERYALEISFWMKQMSPAPLFDVVLLSLGEDGHVASLFPNSTEVNGTKLTAHVTDAPKPPKLRMTMTPLSLGMTKELWFMASGSEKSGAVFRLLTSEADNPGAPATLIRGPEETLLFGDEACLA